MTITGQQVHQIAKLAELQIEDSDVPYFSDELSKMTAFFRMIDKVQLEESAANEADPGNNRSDVAAPSPCAMDIVFGNAPKLSGSSFCVPRVVE